jgi:hypothetical protein
VKLKRRIGYSSLADEAVNVGVDVVVVMEAWPDGYSPGVHTWLWVPSEKGRYIQRIFAS